MHLLILFWLWFWHLGASVWKYRFDIWKIQKNLWEQIFGSHPCHRLRSQRTQSFWIYKIVKDIFQYFQRVGCEIGISNKYSNESRKTCKAFCHERHNYLNILCSSLKKKKRLPFIHPLSLQLTSGRFSLLRLCLCIKIKWRLRYILGVFFFLQF